MKALLKFEMPEKCCDCPLFLWDEEDDFEGEYGFCDKYSKIKQFRGMVKWDEKPDWCPLIPLPEPYRGYYAIYKVIDRATGKAVFEGNKFECAEYLGCSPRTIQVNYSEDKPVFRKYLLRRTD